MVACKKWLEITIEKVSHHFNCHWKVLDRLFKSVWEDKDQNSFFWISKSEASFELILSATESGVPRDNHKGEIPLPTQFSTIFLWIVQMSNFIFPELFNFKQYKEHSLSKIRLD